METPLLQPTPCPKCGGVRFLDDGNEPGLSSVAELSALYCTSCGFTEFYATPHKLDLLAQRRAENAKQREKELRYGQE